MIAYAVSKLPISTIVSIGILNSSLFSTRDIMKSVIMSNAASILVLHLHPSGSLIPSHDDVKATDALSQACDILGISMVDHIGSLRSMLLKWIKKVLRRKICDRYFPVQAAIANK